MILDRYIISRFVRRWILLLFVVMMVLYAIDFLSQMREYDKIGLFLIAKITAYRLPILMDIALPYISFLAVFFTVSGLQNSNVFDVMRASGYTMWRIIIVSGLVAATLGIIHSTIFDSVRVKALQGYQNFLSDIGENTTINSQTSDIWIKTVNNDEIVIMRSKSVSNKVFLDVSIVVMDKNFSLKKRFFAQSADMINDYLLLHNVTIFDVHSVQNVNLLHFPWQNNHILQQFISKMHVDKGFWSALILHLRGQKSFFNSDDSNVSILWHGVVRPFSYAAFAVLACVALLSSHHRTRGIWPFLVSALVMLLLHLGYNATSRLADQGLLPFWYAVVWPSVLLMFGSFLFLIRRTYG